MGKVVGGYSKYIDVLHHVGIFSDVTFLIGRCDGRGMRSWVFPGVLSPEQVVGRLCVRKQFYGLRSSAQSC